MSLEKKEKRIVIYSESRFYRRLFFQLMENLCKNCEGSIHYVTSDYQDLFFENKRIKSYYIGSGLIRQIFFSKLKSRILILTMTDLDNYNIKRSVGCDKYIYIFHSVMSSFQRECQNSFTKNAFKNYDTIFCNGDYHINEINKIEEIHGDKKKELFKCGYFYLDYLNKFCKKNIMLKNTILIAPSWSRLENNLFDSDCFKIVNNLLKNEFNVILRPHPEHFIRSLKLIKKFREINNPNFTIDEKSNNLESLEKAEILLTDQSGVAPEFIFTFYRPVIYIDYNESNRNIYNLVALETSVKEKFGLSVKVKELDELPNKIKLIMKKEKKYEENIKTFVESNFFNLNNVAEIASKKIISYLN